MKTGQTFTHVSPIVAVNYLWVFYYWWWVYRVTWKRYVYSEHVKIICEYNPDTDYFFARSLFRSVAQFNDDEDLDVDWVRGYIAKFDPTRTEINIIYSMPELDYFQFKKKYKELGGSSNW